MSAFLGSGRARVRSSELQDFHFSLSFRRGEGSSCSLSLAAARNLSPRCFCFLFKEKTPLLWGEPWGMLAAHVRRGAGRTHRVLPRLPRTAVPACLIPFSPLFPPNPHRSEHSPGQGKGSAEPPLPARPRPGLGPLLRPPPSPRGNERPLCCVVYLCLEGLHRSFPLEK